MLWMLIAAAMAGRPTPLEIHVENADGEPVREATVLNSLERTPQRVNRETGVWTGDASVLEDGSIQEFEKKQSLSFEIGAPGFEKTRIAYVMRKKKNIVVVRLEPLPIDENTDPDKPAGIMFRGDTPLDR